MARSPASYPSSTSRSNALKSAMLYAVDGGPDVDVAVVGVALAAQLGEAHEHATQPGGLAPARRGRSGP